VTPGSYSSVRKVTTSKLKRKRTPSSVSVLRLVLPSTKTCSFSFVLSQRLVLSELILSEKASFVLGSSSRRLVLRPLHSDYECFVIIKTFLRRSFGDRLYIISFSSSLALNFKSKNACNRACFICTRFAIITSSFRSWKAS
jgi:hypothetical protein